MIVKSELPLHDGTSTSAINKVSRNQAPAFDTPDKVTLNSRARKFREAALTEMKLRERNFVRIIRV